MKQPFSPLPLRWAPRQCTFLNFDVNFKNCCDFYKKFIIEHVLQRVAATLHGLECHRFGASLSRHVLQRVAVTLHGLECHRFGASLSRHVLQRVAVTLHGLECCIDCQNSHKFHFHFYCSFRGLNSALLVLNITASSSLLSTFSTS